MSKIQAKAIDAVGRWPEWLKRAIMSEWTTRAVYLMYGSVLGYSLAEVIR